MELHVQFNITNQRLPVKFGETSQDVPVRFGEVQKVTDASGGFKYEIGHGLKVEDNVLSVDTADVAEQDNTLPITSAAVHSTVGNIEVLLKTI